MSDVEKLTHYSILLISGITMLTSAGVLKTPFIARVGFSDNCPGKSHGKISTVN